MNQTGSYKRVSLGVKENFALQLYIQDIHATIKNYEGLAEGITKGETDEAKCREMFLDYIRIKHNYLNTECIKKPNTIYTDYNLSYNTLIFLEKYLESDGCINEGLYNSVKKRYHTCFVQVANLSFEKAGCLLTNDFDIITSKMEKYLLNKQDMAAAAKNNFDNVKNEIIKKPKLIHPYCKISYNDYLKL